MELKRPRGRPRKNPLPDLNPAIALPEEELERLASTLNAPILSMGMEKVGKQYSTFIMKTQGDRVISKTNFQPDLKISAQMVLHEQIVWAFVNNENF